MQNIILTVKKLILERVIGLSGRENQLKRTADITVVDKSPDEQTKMTSKYAYWIIETRKLAKKMNKLWIINRKDLLYSHFIELAPSLMLV